MRFRRIFTLRRWVQVLGMGCLWAFVIPSGNAQELKLVLSCSGQNDLYQALRGQAGVLRVADPGKAVETAPAGSGVLLLADGYPKERLQVPEEVFAAAAAKQLRLYVEYPAAFPGVELGEPRETLWERLVVSTEDFGKALPSRQILVAHQCSYLPAQAGSPLVVVAKVAGYNTAVYGIPGTAQPILFSPRPDWFLATTKLSHFTTGRFAPQQEWKGLWKELLKRMAPDNAFQLDWKPLVTPAFPRDQPLTREMEEATFRAAVDWPGKSGLMLPDSEWARVEGKLRAGAEVSEEGGPRWESGDGTHGILEGYASQILPAGDQRIRWPVRADCQAETAMVFALDWAVNRTPASKPSAENLLNFLYTKSGMHRGDRGNPGHPGFGLIAWGDIAPAWMVANYGDDNARAMLATMLAAAALGTDQWDEALLKALLANLRTTGKFGFRGDRVDMVPLEQHGWQHFHDAATINYSPQFEAYSWACFLWAYEHTKYPPFLEKTKNAIQMTMEAYPAKWRWNDNMERAHMLLALSWLARIEDTPMHRDWVQKMAYDLMEVQDATGALRERFHAAGGGHYQRPASNEAYGTTETPLMHDKEDPVSDQLYVAGFALLGFHEAASALKDPKIAEAADKLAGYLCRIQNRSEKLPYLDGSWFRAFDFHRWEAWASSGDMGWGAWSIEAGWAQAWGAAIIGLRLKEISFWDLTSKTQIGKQLPSVQALMSRNAGGPWVRPAPSVLPD